MKRYFEVKYNLIKKGKEKDIQSAVIYTDIIPADTADAVRYQMYRRARKIGRKMHIESITQLDIAYCLGKIQNDISKENEKYFIDICKALLGFVPTMGGAEIC